MIVVTKKIKPTNIFEPLYLFLQSPVALATLQAIESPY